MYLPVAGEICRNPGCQTDIPLKSFLRRFLKENRQFGSPERLDLRPDEVNPIRNLLFYNALDGTAWELDLRGMVFAINIRRVPLCA
jgi:hypothetical protein